MALDFGAIAFSDTVTGLAYQPEALGQQHWLFCLFDYVACVCEGEFFFVITANPFLLFSILAVRVTGISSFSLTIADIYPSVIFSFQAYTGFSIWGLSRKLVKPVSVN